MVQRLRIICGEVILGFRKSLGIFPYCIGGVLKGSKRSNIGAHFSRGALWDKEGVAWL
jgi:hypothetical protein